MKRFAWLLLALGMPLSSPLACGGDGCLRNSDCRSDEACRIGKCEPKEPPSEASGGANDEPAPTAGTTAMGGKASSGGSGGTPSGSGSAGKPSEAGRANGGEAPANEAGAGGAAAGEAALGGAFSAAAGAP